LAPFEECVRIIDVIAAWLRTRAEFRASWRAVIVVSLVVAVGGGVALAAAVGARRSQTAMRRFLAYNRPEDATVFFATTPAVAKSVLSLPQVERWMQFPYLLMSTDPSRFDPTTAVFGAVNADALQTIERPMVVHGRRSQPDRSDEVMVNEKEARAHRLRPGSLFTLYAFTLRQALSGGDSGVIAAMRPEGPHYAVRVVGVVREPTDITVVPVRQNVTNDSSGTVYVTPALVGRLARTFGVDRAELPGSEIIRIRFRHGAADLPAFTRSALALSRNKIQILPGSDIVQAANAVQHGINVEVIALWLFAAVAAIATLLVFALNVARLLRSELADHRKLLEIGMSRRQIVAVALARPVAITMLGGFLAIVIAISTSALTPIGLARQAEIHRGVAVNVAMLGAGLGVIVGVALVIAIAFAFASTMRLAGARRTLRGPSARRRARIGESITGAGLSPSIRLGVASVVSADDSGASPRRGAIVAVTIAAAGVVAAATFGASLDKLAATPRQQGWNFDVVVGNSNAQADQEARGVALLARNPYVAGFSALASPPETPTINGVSVGLAGVDARKGRLEPVMLDGRVPQSPNEIVLARATMRRSHVRIGDVVSVVAGARHASFRITGVMLAISAGSFFSGRLDEGGGVTLQGLRRVEPSAIVTMFLVDYARDADPNVALARLQHDFGSNVLQRIPARDVENLVRVDTLPLLLATLLAGLAITTLVYTLTSSVGRRNRELAVLKSLGFQRSQLAASVMWQTWTLAFIGFMVGLPLGVIIGRAAWSAVAGNIGSVQPPVVPADVIAVLVALSALAVTLVAFVPAWLATRVKPATALRAD
jgi:ABC-type antimicrobial peptide transport system permease subunit